MADSKDILNDLGAERNTINDMHAIRKALGGGGGKYEAGLPVKIGAYTANGEAYEIRKCIFEVGSMPAQVPADLVAHLDVALILNIYAVQNSGTSFIDKVAYDYTSRQIAIQNTAYWVERIVIEYCVRV